MVNINLVADVQYEQDVEINIVNLHEIASLMDKKHSRNFAEFGRIFTMKHSKEWCTCDRCGAEIKKEYCVEIRLQKWHFKCHIRLVR